LIATNPPDWAKSTIGNEATGKCSCRAVRGGWEQRASKVKSETWEIPSGEQIGGKSDRVQLFVGMNNRDEAAWEVG
jgi:hypothetical protein